MLQLSRFFLKGFCLALRDDIKGIKQELGSEEQFLENIIRSERFVKKYKKPLLSLAVLLIFAAIGYYGYKFVDDRNHQKANIAYAKLISNPNDLGAQDELKSLDKNLFALFEFKKAVDGNDTKKLQELATLNDIDPILSSIIRYKAGEGSGEILATYSYLMKGYELLKEDKIEAANAEFAKIPINSPLNQIVQNLKHYNGNKK